MHRPVPEAAATLMDMLTPASSALEVRNQVARAIGMGGVTPSMVPQLFAKLGDVSLKADAVLALILVADADTAARIVPAFRNALDVRLIESSPALATAGSAASRISCSMSIASSLPKGVWPQPMMWALFMRWP